MDREKIRGGDGRGFVFLRFAETGSQVYYFQKFQVQKIKYLGEMSFFGFVKFFIQSFFGFVKYLS